jgi:TatD DNase family protein
MIDTHCHIDLYPNPKQIADECERLGIITIGVTNMPSHFELGYKHLVGYKKVRLALGMHPLCLDAHAEELKLFVKNIDKTSYIGEIGLDFSKEGISTKELQLAVFKKIISLISGKEKIISLHSRKAEKETFQVLITNDIKQATFHWYSGPLSLIDDIAKRGYMFSVNSAMTKSKSGQDIIARIPRTHVLTESDGPFIETNGKPTRPTDIIITLDYLANVWKVSTSVAEEIIYGNFKRQIITLK